jgi:uncharacterized Zn finger protein
MTGDARSVSAKLAGLHSAELPCEICGRTTRHRILRISRIRRSADGDAVEGTARCSQCRWTHPFRIVVPVELAVRAVVSSGSRSEVASVRLPSTQRLLVGSRVPGREPPMRVLRIDLRTGVESHDAVARDIGMLWLTPDGPRAIPVSLVMGAKTAPSRVKIPPETVVEVGTTLEVAGGSLLVVGLRARGRTWTRPGIQFPAREIARIYTRRTESPPAGNNRWSRSRESPSSRPISTSRTGRSRSSPGSRINRRRPRARSASGGAAVHNDSPS